MLSVHNMYAIETLTCCWISVHSLMHTMSNPSSWRAVRAFRCTLGKAQKGVLDGWLADLLHLRREYCKVMGVL